MATTLREKVRMLRSRKFGYNPRRFLLARSRPLQRGKKWQRARKKALRDACEICGEKSWIEERLTVKGLFRHTRNMLVVDHVVPERIVFYLRAGNPHRSTNLICSCSCCHSRKTSYEQYLWRGDMLHFLAALNRAGWPMARVEKALEAYGMG